MQITKMDQIKENILDTSERVKQVETSQAVVNKNISTLQLQVEDLEDRSRKNTRIKGLSKEVQNDQLGETVIRLLENIIGEKFKDLPPIEKIYRVPGSKRGDHKHLQGPASYISMHKQNVTM